MVGEWLVCGARYLVARAGAGADSAQLCRRDSPLPHAQVVQSTLVSMGMILIIVMVQSATNIIFNHSLNVSVRVVMWVIYQK